MIYTTLSRYLWYEIERSLARMQSLFEPTRIHARSHIRLQVRYR